MRNEKLEITVAGKIGVTRFEKLERWREQTMRKRAEVIRILLEELIDMLPDDGSELPAVEHFARRLRLEPA